MANELSAAEGFIYAQLSGDSALQALGITGVFSASAPRGQLPPFVIFSYQSSTDVTVVNSIRIALEPLYLVRAVGQTGFLKDLEPLADRIDAVLHLTSGSYGGHLIRQSVREGVYTMTDDSQEIPWKYLGGYYRQYIS